MIWNNRLGVQQDRNDITNMYDQGRLDNNQDRNDTLSAKDILDYAAKYPNNPGVQAIVAQLLGGDNNSDAGAGAQGGGSAPVVPRTGNVSSKVTASIGQQQTPTRSKPKQSNDYSTISINSNGFSPSTRALLHSGHQVKIGRYIVGMVGNQPQVLGLAPKG